MRKKNVDYKLISKVIFILIMSGMILNASQPGAPASFADSPFIASFKDITSIVAFMIIPAVATIGLGYVIIMWMFTGREKHENFPWTTVLAALFVGAGPALILYFYGYWNDAAGITTTITPFGN